MSETIETITLDLPMGLSKVNCYLVGTGSKRVLIDTGPTRRRGSLEWALQDAECEPGDLSLIVLTHGDPDHTGNCAYLRKAFGAKAAMHVEEVGAVKDGNIAASRSNMTANARRLAKMVSPMVRLKRADRFKPDMTFTDGENLASYGVNALVIHTAGHSDGSVSILTDQGDLFCGDLMENIKGPAPGSIADDRDLQAASISRIIEMGAKMVYPGHGDPFTIEEYREACTP